MDELSWSEREWVAATWCLSAAWAWAAGEELLAGRMIAEVERVLGKRGRGRRPGRPTS